MQLSVLFCGVVLFLNGCFDRGLTCAKKGCSGRKNCGVSEANGATLTFIEFGGTAIFFLSADWYENAL